MVDRINKVNSIQVKPQDNNRSVYTVDWNNLMKDAFNGWNNYQNSKPKKHSATELRVAYNNLLKKEYPQSSEVSQEFFNNVFKISNQLAQRNGRTIHCDPEDLLAIMYNESKLDPNLVSSSGQYAGLIQMDKGTYDTIFKNNKKYTYEQYKKLPREKQIYLAQKYLQYRIEHAGKGLDKYIDKNGKIDGGALHLLIWRPGDYETKSAADIAKKVQIKRNSTNKVKQKINDINIHLNQKA
jgi:hypothetical protein